MTSDNVKVIESGTKWKKSMVPISMASINNLVEKFAYNVQRYSFCHARRAGGRTNTTDYIGPYVTHMDHTGNEDQMIKCSNDQCLP